MTTMTKEAVQELLARQKEFYAELDKQQEEALQIIDYHTKNGTLFFEENGGSFMRNGRERTLDETYGKPRDPAPCVCN